MQITMIGHSTLLIEFAQQKILTDPYFGVRGNPAYTRMTPPGKTRTECADADLVLISHNHWDHADRRFLRALGPVPVVVPTMVKWVTKLFYGPENIIGMRVWEEKQFGSVTVTAVPAYHIAVSTGFIIQHEEECIYFAGDTYYGSFMSEIGQRYTLDAALIPVTTFRIPMTMGEKSAVKAVRDLKPSVVIPIHLGVSPRSPLLRTKESPENFVNRLRENGVETQVIILKEGESCVI
jgi:L-ascorbate metabolism protein UlaG (beta-lactamase superfamily)